MSLVYQKRQPKVINNYLFGATCGRGSFGRVKECWECSSGRRVAIKIYSFPHALMTVGLENGVPQLERETATTPDDNGKQTAGLPRLLHQRHSPISPDSALSILQTTVTLVHPNVIRLCEILRDPVRGKIYCVYDSYCTCSLGEFPRLVRQQAQLDYGRALKCIFYQVLLGLEYLHGKGIVHKDVKPENILLTQQGVVKIIDFDVSEHFSPFQSRMAIRVKNSSPIVQPPECLRDAFGESTSDIGQQVSDGKVGDGDCGIDGELVDVWGFGITLYYCAYGTYPFYSDVSVFELFKRIVSQPVVFPSAPWVSTPGDHLMLEDLLRRCLTKEPDGRAKISHLKRHPWFVGVAVDLEQSCTNLSKLLPSNSEQETLAAIDDYLQNKSRVRYRKVEKVV